MMAARSVIMVGDAPSLPRIEDCGLPDPHVRNNRRPFYGRPCEHRLFSRGPEVGIHTVSRHDDVCSVFCDAMHFSSGANRAAGLNNGRVS